MSVASRLFLGVFVVPYRLDSSFSIFSVTASSIKAARSPSGMDDRMSERSFSSLSRSSELAVKVILYLAGASGSVSAGFVGSSSVGGRVACRLWLILFACSVSNMVRTLLTNGLGFGLDCCLPVRQLTHRSAEHRVWAKSPLLALLICLFD